MSLCVSWEPVWNFEFNRNVEHTVMVYRYSSGLVWQTDDHMLCDQKTQCVTSHLHFMHCQTCHRALTFNFNQQKNIVIILETIPACVLVIKIYHMIVHTTTTTNLIIIFPWIEFIYDHRTVAFVQVIRTLLSSSPVDLYLMQCA